MGNRISELISLFKAKGGVLRFSQVLKEGFHPSYLKVLLEKNAIEKIGRGLYMFKGAQRLSNPDLVSAALQSPKAVICLISALAYHEVTDEIPRCVDLAIPRGTRANRIDYPPVRYFRFSKKAWAEGIETHRIDRHNVRIYSLAKTIADCFKFRNKIGLPIALAALKVAITEKNIKPTDIMKFAKICSVQNVIKPYIEAIR